MSIGTDGGRFPLRLARAQVVRGLGRNPADLLPGLIIGGLTIASLAGAPAAADDLRSAQPFAGHIGAGWRQPKDPVAWRWNFYRPETFSAPPLIYPAIGYSHDSGQRFDTPSDNVSFPLSRP